jgi:hypothetical protein
MPNKMLDLVIHVDGGGVPSVLLAVALVILFAAVIVVIMKRK